jgi:hypothetical protein
MFNIYFILTLLLHNTLRFSFSFFYKNILITNLINKTIIFNKMLNQNTFIFNGMKYKFNKSYKLYQQADM